MQVTGLPRYTLSRGAVVWSEGKLSAQPGQGRFVPRTPFAPDARAMSTWKALTAHKAVAR